MEPFVAFSAPLRGITTFIHRAKISSSVMGKYLVQKAQCPSNLAAMKDEPTQFTEREIAERRDAALKRALSMPPKPFTSPAKAKKKAVKTQGRAKPKSA